ncbi:MAG: hypothetical protein NVV79_08355 [Devosia ginsengisoli]|nr:hypothetical protein [Devosia ginsengisoli]MCR6671347.1 hypothetical protein [Devosia ginsengisoli]
MGGVEVGDGIDQPLRQDRIVCAAQLQRHRRGKIAAGAVAADRDGAGVDAQHCGLVEGPARCRDAFMHCAGENMLGRQRIVDADHGLPVAPRNFGRDIPIGGRTAAHPAAAMEIDQAWCLAIVGVAVEHADRHIAGVMRHGECARHDAFEARIEHAVGDLFVMRPLLIPSAVGRQFGPSSGPEGEKGLQLRIEHRALRPEAPPLYDRRRLATAVRVSILRLELSTFCRYNEDILLVMEEMHARVG